MYSSAQLVLKYFRYWLTASNGKGHGVHSPFVFEFITQVLNDKRQFDCFSYIENIRKELKLNKTEITVPDFGAGSRLELDKKRKVSVIAKSSLKPKQFSQLLFRIVHFYKPKNIIEIGTSFGITSSYFSFANPDAKIITLEGAPSIAYIAQQNFNQLLIKNIKLIEGNFDSTLSSALNNFQTIDFAFIDGNHRKQPTLDYFNKLLIKTTTHSIIVIDDIHWSEEMEDAWNEIIQSSSVTLSIDLFFFGIVFFRAEQKTKQHFAIRF